MNNVSIFPRTQPIETCPTCKTPLEEASHGWVKEYRQHEHTSACHRYYGYCMIPCPMCSGGVEAKRQAQLINALFRDSNIPAYAKDWTFTTYPNDASNKALLAVRGRLSDWLEGKPTRGGLYLVGDNGECKTSLAISALHTWLRKGHSGVFLSTVETFDILKDAIAANIQLQHGVEDATAFQSRYNMTRGAKLHRLVKEVELLILDDLGVGCGSAYEMRELYLIIEKRRSLGLFTIFTSNCDKEHLAQHWHSGKTGVFEDSKRIIDRLGEYCFMVPVQGRNQRQK